jgi:MinD-like ATPase involved in chromosome partitioning or flagellar assembly
MNILIGTQGKRVILIEGELSLSKVKSMASLWSAPDTLNNAIKGN